jgi:hypothetical protein
VPELAELAMNSSTGHKLYAITPAGFQFAKGCILNRGTATESGPAVLIWHGRTSRGEKFQIVQEIARGLASCFITEL